MKKTTWLFLLVAALCVAAYFGLQQPAHAEQIVRDRDGNVTAIFDDNGISIPLVTPDKIKVAPPASPSVIIVQQQPPQVVYAQPPYDPYFYVPVIVGGVIVGHYFLPRGPHGYFRGRHYR